MLSLRSTPLTTQLIRPQISLSNNLRAMASSEAGPGPSSLRNLKPPSRPDMKTLDKSAFTVEAPILAAKVKAADMAKIRTDPSIRKWILDVPKAKLVVPVDGEPDHKLLRLKVNHEDELPSEVLEALRSHTEGLVPDTLTLDYDFWLTSDIFNAVLPVDEIDDAPSGFTTTGHIAHLNLRDEWLPYKNFIGEVILDKNQNIRTVVNKLNTIHAEYRYFDMEVLAGDKDFITTVSESGCLFTFNFSLVYWNSRLHSEHERIIETLKPNEVIVDVMAGVGPFAVPAAKKGCSVFGNDLNPESVKWMEVNRVKNKVQDKLKVSEVDGHPFIKTSPKLAWQTPFAPYVPRETKKEREKAARRERERRQAEGLAPIKTATETQAAMLPPRLPDHYIMNLPDSALSFLPSFQSAYTPLLSVKSFIDTYPNIDDVPMPIIHVYCFTREMEFAGAQVDVLKRASGYLEFEITPNIADYELYLVRSVAPNKEMYCLSFRLPREIAFRPV